MLAASSWLARPVRMAAATARVRPAAPRTSANGLARFLRRAKYSHRLVALILRLNRVETRVKRRRSVGDQFGQPPHPDQPAVRALLGRGDEPLLVPNDHDRPGSNIEFGGWCGNCAALPCSGVVRTLALHTVKPARDLPPHVDDGQCRTHANIDVEALPWPIIRSAPTDGHLQNSSSWPTRLSCGWHPPPSSTLLLLAEQVRGH